jgi:hypothetical protein
MYNGLMLFDLTITFLVVRSFTDKSNGSNSIEHHVSSKQNIVKVKGPGKNRVSYGGDQKR